MNVPRRNIALFALLAAVSIAGIATGSIVSLSAASTGADVSFQQNTQNTSTNASITVINQTRLGQSVFVESATLPDGGFVVLKKPGPNGTVVGVSLPLAPGTHAGKITLRGVPGTRLNQSRLGENTTLVATLHRDSDGDDRFGGLVSTTTDEPYTENGTPVRDRARITIPVDARPTTAAVNLTNQTTNGTNITVDSVTLPAGGYVAIHRGSYNGSNATRSLIGTSDYLEPGTYENVTVPIGTINRTESRRLDSGRISAVVYEDTDGDHRFQYLPSGGVEDQPFRENSTPVATSAFVTVNRPPTPTPTTAQPVTQTPTETSVPTPAATATPQPQPATPAKPKAARHDELTPYGGENNARGGIFENPLFPLLVLVFAVFAVLAAVGGR
ncbi:MAG TPA: hypothetical protein VFJ06_08725 [Halococcus sp.]|nr:hypothetical protein [Halococcus sp.]